jgi:hypothetical protein
LISKISEGAGSASPNGGSLVMISSGVGSGYNS